MVKERQSHALTDALRVTPGDAAGLSKRNPASRLGLGEKADGQTRRAELAVVLEDLHNRLWAEARRAVLLVLQGMDASGKDGAIRRVLTGLNPQGCSVVNFKEPTTLDFAHDYLWRVHANTPARGLLGVWNRSHYEDVVTAFCIGAIDERQTRRRYRQIRGFERMLTEEGISVVKVFLHVSKEEQRARLQARIDDPAKNWKFRRSDLDTRRKWDDYQVQYDAAITATSTSWAPWYVVPADHKWVRDVAVGTLLVDELSALDPQIPDPEEGLEGLVVE
ncbi:MAG TPA: PPK2 family polyphosphate kinase [Acidimicrobiia bacterium]|nr:PPK2 family polyphosphate kinase [Acidimicrobiia bacterium]